MKTVKSIAALVLLLFAGSLSGQAQTSVYGDVNCDGEVTISDVNEVINVILGGYQSINIVGSWYSEYFVDQDGRYDIPDVIAVSFDFYNDRTGRYTYSERDSIIHIGLRWNLQAPRLYIWFDDGDYEELFCKIDENGYLLLTFDPQFRNYTAYRPISPSSASGIVMNIANDGNASRQRFRGVVDKVCKTER